jgi:subtilisin family serine protease
MPERRLIVELRRTVPGARAGDLIRSSGAQVVDRFAAMDVSVVRVPQDRSLPRTERRLRRSGLVRRVTRDQFVYPADVPSDGRFGEQWGLHNTGAPHPLADPPPASAAGALDADIDAPEAWDVTGGDPDTVIAVLDSGVDVAHPDLAGNLWDSGDIPGNDVDDDHNGYVDDAHGWDFARDVEDVFQSLPSVEGYDHGTHVAGITAAERNGLGTVGVCPDCSIMVLKFMTPVDTDGDGKKDTMLGRLSALLEGLVYARRMGADVVNASFANIFWNGPERRAFSMLGRAGVLSVVAAGNSNGDNDMLAALDFDDDGVVDFESPQFPAAYDLDSIVAVAASNHGDRFGYFTGCALSLGPTWRCSFTNWGHDSVDLAAPGVDVVSAVPSGYGTFNGTSMAAPMVAGVAGLVHSERPGLRAAQLRNVLLNSVDRPRALSVLHALPGGARQGAWTRTSGRVNALRALSASPTNRHPTSDGTIRGARHIGRSRRGSVSWPRDVNDVFKKRLVRGAIYRIVLNGSRRDDLDLVVYKPGVKDVWQWELGCITGRGSCKLKAFPQTPRGDEAVRFRVRAGGMYVIQVSAYFSSGRYALRVARA